MRILLAVFVVTAALMLPLPRDARPEQEVRERSARLDVKQAVLAANAQLLAAANRGDWEAFFEFILPEAKGAVIEDGVVFATRAEAEQAVRAGFARVARLERTLHDPQVSVISPQAALLTAPGTSVVTLKDGRVLTQRFAVSLIFVRRDEEWRVLHGHFSLPPTAP